MVKKILKYCICLIVCVSVGYGLIYAYRNITLSDRIANGGLYKTDSVYTNRPYELKEIENIQKPNKVVVYQVDTLIRNQVEKDTIITGVTITENQLSIEKITPKGLIFIDTYNLKFDDIKKVEINNKGQLQVINKKPLFRFFKKQAKWVVPVGLILVGVIIGGAVSK